MSSGELGVIHPRGEWGPPITGMIENNKDKIDLSYDDAISYLRGKELDFYHSIFPEVNDLDGFLAKIRELFKINEEDRKIFESFSNANLKRLLPDYKPPVFERGYTLNIIGDSQLIDFTFKSETVQSLNGKLYISIIPENAQLIKRLLNEGLKRKGYTTFNDTNNNISRNLNNILKLTEGQTSKNIGDVFTVTLDKKPINKSVKDFDVVKFALKKDGSGHWTKKELQKLYESNPKEIQKIREELTQSIKYIHDFLFKDYSKASEKMQKAMKTTWSELMGGKDTLQQDFFFEGENYTKTILGQVGEFSNRVLNEYLRLNASDKALPPKLIRIMGSDFEGGQQMHSDIEILLACGASVNQQTKNVSEDATIPVNTNAALVEPLFGQEVISPLVNYFAASDYNSLHSNLLDSFKKIFENNYYAAMNLNVSDKLKEVAQQMNTFYFFGGLHLVPASFILETLKNRSVNGRRPSFEISGGNVSSLTEEEYENKYKTNYIWRGKAGPEMIPSSDNYMLYKKDAASISISTSFSIPALLKSGRFRIFNAI